MDVRVYKSVKVRRSALEKELGIGLSSIASFSFDEELASSRNCENMIGATHVPLGVAGPLQIQDQAYYIPLATTEGALVASVSRGSKAITQSGGASVMSGKVGVTRAPVFRVDNLRHAKEFVDYLENNFYAIKKVVASTSHHLELLKIKPLVVGRNVFVRFHFDSQDAMGMNMATIACTKIVSLLEKDTKAACIAISGNLCVDKKPNYLNFLEGRGHSVWAEVFISKDVVSSVLKTTIDAIVEVSQRKFLGSTLSGSIGANAHYANVLAAIFLATGQDIAHVAECSMGITTVEKVDKNLYVSVYLPDLMIGTVGGGTTLATQKEALSLLGVAGGNNGKNAKLFAEIIAGAVLAGEISLLASISEGSLARAHDKLGRGKK